MSADAINPPHELMEQKRIPLAVSRTWREARAVCFDVDSTVSRVEGIDELARFLGQGAEVSAITTAAMGGSTSFREALHARLEFVNH